MLILPQAVSELSKDLDVFSIHYLNIHIKIFSKSSYYTKGYNCGMAMHLLGQIFIKINCAKELRDFERDTRTFN